MQAHARAAAALAATTAAVALLAGCATSASPGSRGGGAGAAGGGAPASSSSGSTGHGTPTGGDVTDPQNPVDLVHGLDCGSLPASVAGSRLVGFAPVIAVRCPGAVSGASSRPSVATSGLDSLVAAFEQPSQPRSSGICPDYLVHTATVVFIDRAGDRLVPRYPTDDCGKPLASTVAAVNAAPWTPLPGAR